MKQKITPNGDPLESTETANLGEILDIFNTDQRGDYIKFDATSEIKLAKTSAGDVRNTRISPWILSFAELEKFLATPIVGEKNGTYFVRATGENRSDFELAEYSGVLILDGDSRIADDGEILDGCVSMQDVHGLLVYLAVPHIIYPSHSCFSSLEKLNHKDEALRSAGKTPKNRGGVSHYNFYKWRLLIPCRYEKQQLKYLVNFFIKILNKNDLSVADVPENCRWSQPWFLPRVDKELELDFSLHTFSLLEGYSLSASKIIDLVVAESPVNVHNHHQKEQDLVAGFVSPITAFNIANNVRHVLEENGYTACGHNRYIRPGSVSGQAGLSVLKDEITGIEYAYSFGGDVLNDGKRHDAFDVFRLLQHDGDLKAALAWDPEITDHNLQQRQLEHESNVINSFDAANTFEAPALVGCDSRDGNTDTRPLTEVGNAMRFLDKHQADARFVVGTKNSWLIWKDGSWIWSKDGAIITEMMFSIPGGIYQEASRHLRDAGLFIKWARTSQKNTTIDNTISLLSSKSEIRVSLAFIDSNPYLVGIDNARMAIDLRTGVARNADQADLITKTLGVNQLGNSAEAIRWSLFLNQVFNGDQELIDWLKRYMGYLLTGAVDEQIVVFGFGLGANGKSVLAEILRYIMADYSRVMAPETIGESRRSAGAAAPDLMVLLGARLAISTETEDGLAFNESLVKLMTGGDAITARGLYKDNVEFKPQFKLLIFGNHKPIVKGTDHGIWRRIRLLPFTQTFDGANRDPNLLETLKNEAPHILAWMVEGCLEWQRLGLSNLPKVIADATAEYRAEQDLIGHWLDECCVVGNMESATIAEAYLSYTNWASRSGLKPCSKIALTRRLEERGFEKDRNRSAWHWCGFGINQAACWDAMEAEAKLVV